MEQYLISLTASLIRRVREAHHLTQEELSARAGLDRTYISGVERGVRNISLKSLGKILKALELDIPMFCKELSREFDLAFVDRSETNCDQ